MSQSIPFIDLQAQRERLGQGIEDAIARVLAHGKFIMGPEVRELESQLTAFCGASHAVSCASGTDALMLPLLSWGVGPGDAVFVPTFTFVSTAEVVCLLGATPVMVDVARDSFNMDAESLRAAIGHAQTQGLTPKAVIPVDLFGRPADYDELIAVARDHGLKVLADAAQSFGGAVNGRRCGTFGDATATSFFPAKPLGCYGDGGAIFTDDAELAAVLRSLRVHGQGRDKYDNVRIGLNARLDTMQAAILLEKLAIFDEELEARDRIAQRYHEGLAGKVRVPRLPAGVTSAWAQYTIRVPDRDRVADALKTDGIPTAIYYPIPLHRQTGYTSYPTALQGAPVSEELADSVLSLPMHPYLEPRVQDQIIGAVLRAAEPTQTH